MKGSSNNHYINAFNLIPGIGPQKMHKMANYFDDFVHAWHAAEEELCCAGLSPDLARSVTDHREKIDVRAEWEKCLSSDVKLLTFSDKRFPQRLKQITNPPFSLYVRGDIDVCSTDTVTVVGSRKISAYAERATKMIVRDLVQNKITIISGLALGTDALAHASTVTTNGKTIAVLGGGVDDRSVTPRTHIGLAHDIIRTGGAIISEYPCGSEPHRGTFPARNRLMAGLSDAVIIVEAAKRSGTLITADWARKFDKELLALPGSIFSENTYGPHKLIQKGYAKPLLTSNDVLRMFDKTHKEPPSTVTFSDKDQEDLYNIIKKHTDGIQINALIKESSLEGHAISSSLTLMEIDEKVKNIGNQTYICT